jgi:hypothetical protein
MKRNITLKLDEELIREAKLLAAHRETSVSQLLTEVLEEQLRQLKGYEAARRRSVARLRRGYDLGWQKPASRDELHER